MTSGSRDDGKDDGKRPPTRDDRLAAALRANLKRRKAVTRAKTGEQPATSRPDAPDKD